MTATLRPMSLGEILDRTFQIYRSRFLVFVGIAALPAVAMLALQIANQFWWKLLPEPFGRRVFLWFTPQGLLYALVLAHAEIFFDLFLWPVYAFVASKCIFEETSSITAALSACCARWRSWIAITVVGWSLPLLLPEVAIAALLAGVLYLLSEVLKLDDTGPTDLGPRMFVVALAIGWAIFQWISSGLSFSVPAWILEGLRTRAAIRRGWKLSRGSRLRAVFVRVMPVCIGWVLTITVSRVVLLLLYLLFRYSTHWWFAYRNVFAGVSIFAGAAADSLVGPIYPIALTLFYYDQRIRREGYDIEWMMNAAGMNAPVTLPAGDGERVTSQMEEA